MLDPHQSFHIFRHDRADRTGGGVCAALIPKSIRCSEHFINSNERDLLLKTGSELICIDAQLGQSKFRFILVYRPPACSSTQAESIAKTSNLKSLLSCLIHPSYNSVILGDFNLPKIKWSTLEYPLDGVHDVLFELFSCSGFTLFVTDPTHITHSANNNILDLILSNNQLCLNIDEIGAPLSTSDHAIIHFSIFDTSSSDVNIVNDINSVNLTCYDWSGADYTEINNAIHSIDWHSLFGYNFSADNMWTEFKKLLWPIISVFVPHKIVSHHVKYRPRCYPSNIRKLLTRKAAIWRKLKISHSPALFAKYRTVANECKLEILKYDTLKEQKILDAQNLGAFYKFVNRKIGNQSGVAPLKDDKLNLITSDIDKANLLNAYFESTFTNDNGSSPNFSSRLQNRNDGIDDVKISPSIVKNILKKLKSNSAAGPDGLPQ